VETFGVEAFDDRLFAVDEFLHVSVNPANRAGDKPDRSHETVQPPQWRGPGVAFGSEL
jgi:hypothetical protein